MSAKQCSCCRMLLCSLSNCFAVIAVMCVRVHMCRAVQPAAESRCNTCDTAGEAFVVHMA